MTASLSRRGLFRAFGASPATAPEDRALPPLARLSEACVEPRGVTCRRCGEACEPGAIRFRLQRGGAIPSIDAERCTGCGDCLGVCPVSAIALVSRERATLVNELATLSRSA
jgi:ferredoxin-type protein NapF